MSVERLKKEVLYNYHAWTDQTIQTMKLELREKLLAKKILYEQFKEEQKRMKASQPIEIDDDDNEHINSGRNHSQRDDREDISVQDLIEKCQEQSEKMKKVISNFHHTEDTYPLLTMELRNYQKVGVSWLWFMFQERFNGILADEMGLGKTIQTIAFLAKIRKESDNTKPHLVIVPLSTLNNWEREFSLWCPKLKVCKFHGEDMKSVAMDLESNSDDYDVILTTYGAADGKYRRVISRLHYCYLILDEAQNIKNINSLRYKCIDRVHSDQRLLLTGTPLQNNLLELWNLLTFLMPQLFASGYGDKWLEQMTEAAKSAQDRNLKEVQMIREIVTPFVLRRLKSDVTAELLPKLIKVKSIDFTPEQTILYERAFKEAKESYSKSENNTKLGLGPLMTLRKIATHPLLARTKYNLKEIQKIAKLVKSNGDVGNETSLPKLIESYELLSDFDIHELCCEHPYLHDYALTEQDLFESSGKFSYLKKLIPRLIAKGSRMVIFSQFIGVLNILEFFLQHLNYEFERIDGSVRVDIRQERIDRFNTTPSIPVFLLSTNAGGVGINLATADVAIFMDLNYNIQNDRQAEDRIHRIGQTKQVIIYKLLSKDSVDEDIHSIASAKANFADVVLEEGVYEEKNSKSLLKTIFNKKK